MPPIELIDSYAETNYNIAFKILAEFPAASGWGAIGQAITIAQKKKVTSIKFYLNKTGLPVADLVARIYPATGTVGSDAKPSGNPTDAPLAESDEVQCTSLSAGMSLIEFTFSGSNQITLQANTDYCFLVLPKSVTTLDVSNYFMVGADWINLTHAGNICALYDGGWQGGSSYDTIFYLYGR